MAERCELSDLPTDQCACRIHGPKEENERKAEELVVRAQFESDCRGCDRWIRKGDFITQVDGCWIHLECVG